MQNLKYKAVALDLDGTLTDSDKKLPLKNKEALWKAMDLGVQVILISGRSVMGITGLAKELEFEKRGGIIAAFNGGKTFDYKTGTMIQQLFFPREAIADTCAIVRKYGAQPLSYTDNINCPCRVQMQFRAGKKGSGSSEISGLSDSKDFRSRGA